MWKRIYFDIEADHLLRHVSRMWLLFAIDLDTGEKKYFLEGDHGWRTMLDNADLVVGHNITGYDLKVLKKLFGYVLKKHTKRIDTAILSRVLNWKRFGNDVRHSLEAWGVALGFAKIDFDEFSQYSPEMLTYCERDCELGVMIFNVVMGEFIATKQRNPVIAEYLRAEHAVADWSAEAELQGWPFDLEAAIDLEKILQKELDKAHEQLSHKLGMKAVIVDRVPHEGIGKPLLMKWTKQGWYDATKAKWFGIDPVEAWEEVGERPYQREFVGDYCRVVFEDLDLNSSDDVKVFLYRQGWEPDEFNYKKDPITKRKTKEISSAKITESSLEFLGGDGVLYREFVVAKSRHSNLKTWIEECDADGNLHGSCMTVGTPSMRATHKVIVNIPSSDSAWGRQMRSLFKCKSGWKLIGCDSASNQARGLAHNLGDPVFTDTLINGDIHKYNAVLLERVLDTMGFNWTEFVIRTDKARIPATLERWLKQRGITKREYLESRLRSNRLGARKWADKFIFAVKRAAAKRILYAFLFGAGGAKLWLYITGVSDTVQGNKLKNGFTKAVPGFRDLIDKLERIYNSTKKYGDGYIPGIGGNRIYVDSNHKLLVYHLQATEKATCAAATMLIMERLEAAGIPYIPCIFMHDEDDFMVPEEYAEQARQIGKQAFADGPKIFGVTIMDGSGKIGDNWYDVH